MVHHINLGTAPETRRKKVHALIAAGRIRFGGHKKLKIYGTLGCTAGKRMRIENRVFFETEQEAIRAGYRPCGHCMRKEYEKWRYNLPGNKK